MSLYHQSIHHLQGGEYKSRRIYPHPKMSELSPFSSRSLDIYTEVSASPCVAQMLLNKDKQLACYLCSS